MAFCSSCGTNLGGQAVCPNCGTPAGQTIMVSGNTSVIQGAPKSERSMAIAQMDDVISHFGGVEKDFYLFIQKSDELEKKKKVPGLSLLILAPVVWILGLVAMANISFLNYGIIGVVWMLLCFLVPLVYPFIARSKNTKAIKRLDKETDDLAEALLASYKSYEGEMPIGFEYYNPEYMSDIRNMLTSGRATNIPAAINLILDDKHKQIMELRALLTQNAAEAAAAMSAEAAASARDAAASASRAEFNSWSYRS